MEFGDKLMELRRSKGWSQEDLGDQLDVSRQTVSKWEMGQTTPEMKKLKEISRVFEISLDELLDNDVNKRTDEYSKNLSDEEINNYEKYNQEYTHRTYTNETYDKETGSRGFGYYRFRPTFEYKSKRTLRGLPLVHINMGFGLRKAKGIIAIGNIAVGVIALGLVSAGLLSFGVISVGVLAFAALAAGILSCGAISVGVLAFGAIAVGIVAVGGLAIGQYSMGGCAIANKIAMGGYAQGFIAIGDKTTGSIEVSQFVTSDEIRKLILMNLPHTPKVLVDLFSAAGR